MTTQAPRGSIAGMFSRQDRYRDTLLAAAGLLAIAAILAAALAWLVRGLDAAGGDLQRFDSARTQGDIAGYGGVIVVAAIILVTLIVGAVGIALWMIVGGWKAHRGARNAGTPRRRPG